MADIGDYASVLNGLIETCKHGEEGFKKAAEKVKDSSLKSLFTKYSSQRAGYVTELQSAVRAFGKSPAESGHVAASLHRGWMSVKEAVTSSDDRAIINEAEAGEDAAIKNYKEALEKPLSADLKSLVQRQYSGVQEAHGIIRELKHSGATSVSAARV